MNWDEDRTTTEKFREFYHRFFFIIFFGLIFTQGVAQNFIMPAHVFTVRHDNDLMNLPGKGTDEYYTAGINIQYGFTSSSKRNLLRHILPLPVKSDTSLLSIGATQWMYTPSDLEATLHRTADYPYSGTLFLDLSRQTIFRQRNFFGSSLWLGVMGPSALGWQTQLFVHKVMGLERPKGWDGQLPDYPVINYNLFYERNLAGAGSLFKLNGFGYLQVGSLLNTASAGLNVIFSGKKDNYFPDRYFVTTSNEKFKRVKFFLQVRPSVKLVATNALLEGGLFQTKNYYHIEPSSVERFVYALDIGAGIHVKRFLLEYKQVLQSPEFSTVHGHMYGSVVIGINF